MNVLGFKVISFKDDWIKKSIKKCIFAKVFWQRVMLELLVYYGIFFGAQIWEIFVNKKNFFIKKKLF